MNYDKTYQRMIRRVSWKNIQGGYGWPGKPVDALAVTRYPNILAEIEAYTGWLHIPAEFAAVSQEVMAAVVEDGEELSSVELFGLCRLYGRKLAYLAAPVLQFGRPGHQQGKIPSASAFGPVVPGGQLAVLSSMENRPDP